MIGLLTGRRISNREILIQGKKGYSILIGCGDNAVLLVLANEMAKQGILFLEIKRLQGKHTESVLRGGNHDIFEFRELQ